MADYYSGWDNDQRLYVSVADTQNVETNTSTVSVAVYLEQRNGRSVTDSNTLIALGIGGVSVVHWQGYASYAGASHLIATGSRVIPHGPDGSIPGVQVSAGIYFPSLGWNPTRTVDHPLPTIPRATTPSLSGGGGFVTGETKTISLPRASSGFTHDVSYKFGSQTGTIATGAGVSTTWLPPHTLLTEIPNAASGTVEITVVTKSGATVIGTRKVNFTLTANSSQVPAVSQVLWDDNNPTVKAAVGAFVQGLSLIKGAVTAAGVQGSTIAEKRLRIGSTLVPEGTPIQIAGSGTVTAQGEAVDSRGRLGTLSADFGVLAYEPPRLGPGGLQVRRANSGGTPADDGEYLRLDLDATAKSLVVGTEKNALTIQVRTRTPGGSWTARNTITPGLAYNTNVLISGGAVFLASGSYEVEISLSDVTGIEPTRLLTTIPTATVTLDLSGTKVGIGGYNTRGSLEVWGGDGYAPNWRADENVYAGGTLLLPIGVSLAWTGPLDDVPAGYLPEDGRAVSRTTYSKLFALYGTTYGAGDGSTTFNIRDKRGRVGVTVNPADTEFDTLGEKFGTKTHTLTTAQLPTFWGSDGGVYVAPQGSFYGLTARASIGSGQAHNNIQPSIAEYSIVRAL